jgi:glyoxylase-like metal-dependent hydrolase (beta-lactamase superfamily II)
MKLRIGSTSITSVFEQDVGRMLDANLPLATPAALDELTWLWPDFMDGNDQLQGVIQSFVVQHRGKLVVVDTGVGDDKDISVAPELAYAHTGFLERFIGAGFDPAAVDYVVCTHMHLDHVGWNTYLRDGRWQPAFPNARYLFVADELAHWAAQQDEPVVRPGDFELPVDAARQLHNFRQTQISVYRESIQPVLDAGLADVTDVPYVVLPGLTLIPGPGHTPGHVMVQIQSATERALIAGDAFHHPCQIAHPEWDDLVDTDLQAGAATRQQILTEIVDTTTYLMGSHFSHPSYGTVARSGTSFRFEPGAQTKQRPSRLTA